MSLPRTWSLSLSPIQVFFQLYTCAGDLDLKSFRLTNIRPSSFSSAVRKAFYVHLEDDLVLLAVGRNEEDEDISWFQDDAKTLGRYDQDIQVTTTSAPITTAGVSVSTAEPSTLPTTTTLLETRKVSVTSKL
ncbi:hypothetical protein Tco_0746661 [Tanacetum coccineum]